MRRGHLLPVGSSGSKVPLLLPSSPISVDRVELAWAAGFFDGEGSTFPTGKRRHPRISITQAPDPRDGTSPEVLHRFRRAVGEIGSVRGPYREKSGELKFLYNADGHEMVQAVIALLWEWLGDVKRQQATATFQAHRQLPRLVRKPGVRFGRPLKSQCKRGHDYSDVWERPGRSRHCRPCARERCHEKKRRLTTP